jgi:hypothetical protein
MFRLFTDAENVRELLVHRCRSQHFEPRKRRVYEVLFAELLKLGAPSTSETDSDETLTQERQRAGWAPRGRGSSIRLVRCGQEGEDVMRFSCHAVPEPSEDLLEHTADAEKDGVRLWLLGAKVE